MSTERWIVLCAIFAVAAFFAGTLYGEATMRVMVDGQVDQVRELEMVVHSMERLDVKGIGKVDKVSDEEAKC